MRLTNELCKKIKNIAAQYERSYPVPFKPILPITLRDRVSNKVTGSKERPCVPELTVLLQCFKDSDFNEQRCSEATKSFYACLDRYNEAKSISQEGRNMALVKNVRDLTPAEINKLLQNNPQI